MVVFFADPGVDFEWVSPSIMITHHDGSEVWRQQIHGRWDPSVMVKDVFKKWIPAMTMRHGERCFQTVNSGHHCRWMEAPLQFIDYEAPWWSLSKHACMHAVSTSMPPPHETTSIQLRSKSFFWLSTLDIGRCHFRIVNNRSWSTSANVISVSGKKMSVL